MIDHLSLQIIKPLIFLWALFLSVAYSFYQGAYFADKNLYCNVKFID